jgi:hypothetical protein
LSDAGFELLAGRIPGERIATDIDTSDSSTFTSTETEVQAVTAALVSGRIYRVRAYTRFNSSVATDTVLARLRQDNSTGTEMSTAAVDAPTNVTHGAWVMLEAEYTAVASANKTFVLTGIRASGTGNCLREAAANRVSYLYVDYIRG